MRMDKPRHAMQVCVSKCPDRDLNTPAEAKAFAEETGSRICRYDIKLDQYDDPKLWNTNTGPCPQLPVYKRLIFIL